MPSIDVQIICSDGTTKRKLIAGLNEDQEAILGFLETNNLLTEKLCDEVTQEKDNDYLYDCAGCLEALSEINWINQKTFNYIWTGRDDNSSSLLLSYFLKLLDDNHIEIDDQLLDMILLHPAYDDLYGVSGILSRAKLLTVDNFKRVVLYINPVDIGQERRKLLGMLASYQQAQAPNRSQQTMDATQVALLESDTSNDLYLRLQTGLRQISPILWELNHAQLLTQQHLNTILDHQFPAFIRVLLERLERTGIPLKPYLIPIINNPDEEFIEHVERRVWQLKKSGILNKDTFDLVLAKYFWRTAVSEDIKAVQRLIQHDLFTKPNLHFIKYGHFLVFGNHKEDEYFLWKARSEALVSLKANKSIHLECAIPLNQYEEVNEPLQKAMNKLFKMTTDYLYQPSAKGKNHELCCVLCKLQSALFAAYSQFETDKNVSCLEQSFNTHIDASREYLERAYSFTEQIQKLFNELLNAIQSVLGVSKDRPWGTFFTQGHRVELMTDLIHAPKMQELSDRQVSPPDAQRP